GTMISGSFNLAAHHGSGSNSRPQNGPGRHPEAPISSRHPNGETVRFYKHRVKESDGLNNPNNFEERTITQTWHVGNINGNTLGGDIEAGKFDSPVSTDTSIYPILLLENASDYAGIETLNFGKSSGAHGDPGQRDSRLGKRFIGGAGSTSIWFQFGSFPEYSRAIIGDSGSPSLGINVNRGFRAWGEVYVGAHWFPTSDGAVTTIAMRDALLNDMISAQPGVLVHEREVPTYYTGILGDFDGSFEIDAADMDIIIREARMFGSRGYNWYLDFTNDGQVNHIDTWIMTWIAGADFGDIDMDGDVDSTDLGRLLSNFNKTEQGWADGDFNGDGTVNSTDLGILLNNF
ncbi:dockerin type I repeat-containing protein, partial [bacterium]|nr:dockerin type I repeat-containing protein [bacterium]